METNKIEEAAKEYADKNWKRQIDEKLSNKQINIEAYSAGLKSADASKEEPKGLEELYKEFYAQKKIHFESELTLRNIFDFFAPYLRASNQIPNGESPTFLQVCEENFKLKLELDLIKLEGAKVK